VIRRGGISKMGYEEECKWKDKLKKIWNKHKNAVLVIMVYLFCLVVYYFLGAFLTVNQ